MKFTIFGKIRLGSGYHTPKINYQLSEEKGVWLRAKISTIHFKN